MKKITALIVIAVILLLGCVQWPQPSYPKGIVYRTGNGGGGNSWWNTSWSAAIPCTIQNITQSFNNFPARCDVDTSNPSYFNLTLGVPNRCTNVRILDYSNTSVLNYELDSNSTLFCGNATNNATYWISMNYSSTTPSQNVVFIYVGNLGATNGQNAKAVWQNANYSIVYHFSSNTSGVLRDSANGNTANYTGNCSMIQTYLGYGYVFNGTSGCIIGTTASSVIGLPTQNPVTIEAWVLQRKGGATGVNWFGFGKAGASNDYGIGKVSSTNWSAGGYNVVAQAALVYDQYAHYSAVYTDWNGLSSTSSRVNATMYLNSTNQTKNVADIVQPLTSPTYEILDSNTDNATVTEARISNDSKSLTWLDGENNQTWIIGPAQTPPTGINLSLSTGISSLLFLPLHGFQQSVAPQNQTSTTGVFNVTNYNSTSENISLYISPVINGFTVRCSPYYNMSSQISLNSTPQFLLNLSASSSANVWCLADFNNPAQGTGFSINATGVP